MSENEIKRRREYKLNRKKWTMIQIIAIVLAAVIALGSFMIYDRMNTVDKARKDAETELAKILDTLEYEFTLEYWEIKKTGIAGQYNLDNFANYGQDVTIFARLTYPGVELIPMDDDKDGNVEYYVANTYGTAGNTDMVVIPSNVNGDPVTTINANAFASYDGVHSVVIPNSITYIGDNAFAKAWDFLDPGETVTIYFVGTLEQWQEKEKGFASNWESGVSGDTRIFFVNPETNKVDVSQSYLQAKKTGTNISWTETAITTDVVNEYTGFCDCERDTTGDTAHTYVDANGNVMGRNEDGTPLGVDGTPITRVRSGGNFITGYTYALKDDSGNEYKRYRPDRDYWPE